MDYYFQRPVFFFGYFKQITVIITTGTCFSGGLCVLRTFIPKSKFTLVYRRLSLPVTGGGFLFYFNVKNIFFIL
jgi:hypothetical protein